MAFEFQDDPLARGGARQAESGLGHFRAGGAEADALGRGNAFADDAGGLEFDLGLAGVKNALVDLFLDRLLHALGRMAQDHRAHAAVIIDQPVAVAVQQGHDAAAHVRWAGTRAVQPPPGPLPQELGNEYRLRAIDHEG